MRLEPADFGGEIGVSISGISETQPLVESKRLRALGVTSLKRSLALPDLPTIAEAGVPGYEFVTWHGVLAPRATPRATVAFLSDRIRQVMRAPEFARAYEQRGFDIIASSPDEFAAHLKKEVEKWSRVIKERGMHAD